MKKKIKDTARIYDPVGAKTVMIPTIWCTMCENVATHRTSNDMPLCDACATVYELGQDNPDNPLEEIRSN